MRGIKKMIVNDKKMHSLLEMVDCQGVVSNDE